MRDLFDSRRGYLKGVLLPAALVSILISAALTLMITHFFSSVITAGHNPRWAIYEFSGLLVAVSFFAIAAEESLAYFSRWFRRWRSSLAVYIAIGVNVGLFVLDFRLHHYFWMVVWVGSTIFLWKYVLKEVRPHG